MEKDQCESKCGWDDVVGDLFYICLGLYCHSVWTSFHNLVDLFKHSSSQKEAGEKPWELLMIFCDVYKKRVQRAVIYVQMHTVPIDLAKL